jgi:hypothetical protein
VLAVVGFMAVLGAMASPRARFRNTFKQQVIGTLLRTLGEGLSFHPLQCIPQSEFQSCGLFHQTPDRYRGEDRVQGRQGATEFRFSEVHAEYKTESTDSKGNRTTHWHDIFRGILFVADFNKTFAGHTVVVPDTAERWLGSFGQALQSWGSTFSSLELVRLEDPDFEKAFKVMASDQIEARYILSTSLMRRILEFQAKTGKAVSLSFRHANVYIAVPSTEDRFEPPSIFSSVHDSLRLEQVERHLADLRLFINIVEDLDLNTRVWSKGTSAV